MCRRVRACAYVHMHEHCAGACVHVPHAYACMYIVRAHANVLIDCLPFCETHIYIYRKDTCIEQGHIYGESHAAST